MLTEGNITSIQKCYALFCENHKKDLVDKCSQICDNITERTMKEVRKDGNFARRRCVAFMQCLSLRKVVKSKRINAHEPPKRASCAFYILGRMYCELFKLGRLCRWKYLQRSGFHSTDKVSALTSYCVSGGRLNAYKALSNVHSFTYTHTATTHTATCNCGKTKTEEHTYKTVGIRYVCTICGYWTTTP